MALQSPSISVLMPIWNRVHLVQNAIQSIIDQIYEDWELIIVDDGSDDGTKRKLAEYVKLDARIKVFYQKHAGLVRALQFGNQVCKGNIIVKQDSDDMSMPDRLGVIARYFQENLHVEFFYHGMYQTWFDEKHPEIIHRTYLPALPIEKKKILKSQYIPGCFAYSKRFIEEVPYRQLHCSEDWMLILDAFFKKRNIGFLNQGLYEYALREDSNSLMHEGTGHYEEDEKIMRDILRDEYAIKHFNYAPRK